MKTPLTLTALALAFASATAQTPTTMQLTPKQAHLATIACLEAKGDTAGLRTALNEALGNTLTLAEAKETLSHLYAYTGFPRALNALATLQALAQERASAGQPLDEAPAFALPPQFDALAQGTQVQAQLCGGTPFSYPFEPRIDYYLKAHLFGDIFASPVLSPLEREIVTVSALSALEGCSAQLQAHVKGSQNFGVTPQQLLEASDHLARTVGQREAQRIRQCLLPSAPDSHGKPAEVDFNVWPKGEPNTAYAQYFTGNSYLAPLDAENGGPNNVTFEPACRNNWHVHHDCVQVLICVAGRGWYQAEGEPARPMTPGTVIAVPEGVKHWHGAARDSWFQHIAYNTLLGPNPSNDWLEPVDDDTYYQLP